MSYSGNQTISNNLSVGQNISALNISASKLTIDSEICNNLTVNSSLTLNNQIDLNVKNINSSGTISASNLSIPNINTNQIILNNVNLNTRLTNDETNIQTNSNNISTNTTEITNIKTRLNTDEANITNLQNNTQTITYSSSTTQIPNLNVSTKLINQGIIEDAFIINSSNYTQVFYDFPLYRTYIITHAGSITIRFPVAPTNAVGQTINIRRTNYLSRLDNFGIFQAQNGVNIIYNDTPITIGLVNVDCTQGISVFITNTTTYTLLNYSLGADNVWRGLQNFNSNISVDTIDSNTTDNLITLNDDVYVNGIIKTNGFKYNSLTTKTGNFTLDFNTFFYLLNKPTTMTISLPTINQANQGGIYEFRNLSSGAMNFTAIGSTPILLLNNSTTSSDNYGSSNCVRYLAGVYWILLSVN